MLMFVSDVKGQFLELRQVGNVTTAATLRANAPPEALRNLVGRWVWIVGAWGDRVEIEHVVPLPEWKGADHG